MLATALLRQRPVPLLRASIRGESYRLARLQILDEAAALAEGRRGLHARNARRAHQDLAQPTPSFGERQDARHVP